MERVLTLKPIHECETVKEMVDWYLEAREIEGPSYTLDWMFFSTMHDYLGWDLYDLMDKEREANGVPWY